MLETIIVILVVLAAAFWVVKTLVGSLSCRSEKCQCGDNCRISKWCHNAAVRSPSEKTNDR
ncbi:MAG: hypothetical protein ACOYVF_06995 [Candidatus Zixiibacteriota bacterium]